jgi:hypothetical protein
LRWIAGLSVAVKKELGSDALANVLPLLLPPLVREYADPTCLASLHELCDEVSKLLKSLVGAERFAKYFAEAQADINSAKLKRKVKRAQLVSVLRPVHAYFCFND